jgi:prevent-host-death family protein
MQVNVHEAKTQLSRLLELVEQGETVTIARHGKPVAELVRARPTSFPLGAARGYPLVPPGDEWWQPMTDQEAEDWIDGK